MLSGIQKKDLGMKVSIAIYGENRYPIFILINKKDEVCAIKDGFGKTINKNIWMKKLQLAEIKVGKKD
jgi:hypothetical protein